MAFSQGNNSGNESMGNIEVKDEEQNVLKSLLRGELTQEVKELRHEMYYADRGANKYDYVANGYVKEKKNNIFTCKGNFETSDGLTPEIVIDNKEFSEGVADTILNDSAVSKFDRKFAFDVERSFTPRFRIEEYASMLVVKRIDAENAVIDIYTTQYMPQFNRRTRMFVNEVGRIYEGDKRSEVVDIDKISFTTTRAGGSDDMFYYEYDNIKFEDILKYNGNYVLRFKAHISVDGEDLLKKNIYDEIAAKKFENKEKREGCVIVEYDVQMHKIKEEEDTDKMMKVFNEFKKEASN